MILRTRVRALAPVVMYASCQFRAENVTDIILFCLNLISFQIDTAHNENRCQLLKIISLLMRETALLRIYTAVFLCYTADDLTKPSMARWSFDASMVTVLGSHQSFPGKNWGKNGEKMAKNGDFITRATASEEFILEFLTLQLQFHRASEIFRWKIEKFKFLKEN